MKCYFQPCNYNCSLICMYIQLVLYDNHYHGRILAIKIKIWGKLANCFLSSFSLKFLIQA